MGGLQSKKYYYEASVSKSESQSIVDDELSKRRSNFTRNYRPVSASPAGAAAAARILNRYTGSPMKKRLKIDKNTSREPVPKKNIKDIEKENFFEKENAVQKAHRSLMRKICLRGRPSYRKSLNNTIDEEEPLLVHADIVVHTNCETNQNILQEQAEILRKIKLDKLKWQILSRMPIKQAVVMEKLMTELKQHLAQWCENTEINTATPLQEKKETGRYKLKICHHNTDSRYNPYKRTKRTEDLRVSVPYNQKVVMWWNVEQGATEISLQADNSHDSTVISARSSLSEDITKELKRRIANRNLENEVKSNKTDKIKLQILAKIPEERVIIMEKLMTELKQRLSERNQAKNNNINNNKVGVEIEIRTVSQTVLKKENLKPISTRSYYFMHNHKSRYVPYEMAKQKPKQHTRAPVPTVFEAEKLEQEVRRSLRPRFLSEIPKEQVMLIENVISELKECLAKRNVEHKDKPKSGEVKRSRTPKRCLESTELKQLQKMQIRTV